MFILLALCIILARLSSSYFSPDRVFRRRCSAIIARPLGRPQTANGRRISSFLSFFRHFHRGNRTHPPRTQIFSNSFPIFSDTTWPPLGKQMTTHVSHRTSILLPPPNSVQSCILLLLIIGGVEVNPGPSSSVNLTFGSLNSRSVVNKAPLLHRLQSVLNSAARLVLNIPKFSHISAAIRVELHWLPIRRRIDFKIALMVCHCLVGAAPEYLMELCHPVGSAVGRQCLQSASRGDLVVPRFRLQTFGHRAFAVSRPQIWNSLPLRVRQSRDNLLLFKQKLKAHLFQQFWALLWMHI